MLAGLGTLVGLVLRRDRIKLPLILVIFIGSLIAMIPMLNDIYGDAASIQALYQSFGTNPAMLFMTGPIDEPTFGALVTIETLLWWGLAVAFINTMLVVRHTRHNEEIGAQELLLSGQTHRATSLLAAMLMAVAVNLVIAVGLGFGMQISGATWGADQAWLYGLAIGGFGLVWSGIAAVVVQLVSSGRSANGLLAGLIGLGFILRGVGDFLGQTAANGLHEPAWVSYLSPFGWLQLARPLTEPNWMALVIPLIGWLVMFGLALALLAKRDVGEGLLPSLSGKARASRFLATPVGLALKLQKNVFIGWLVGVLVMVVTIGAMVPQMGDVLADSDSMKQLIEQIGGTGQLIPTFMSVMISITVLLVFAYVIHALSRLRSEEASGHLESLLATKLWRLKWLGIHFDSVSLAGTLMLSLTGCGLALCINWMSDYSVDVWQYTLAGLSYVPVMLAFMALYLALFGLLPRAATAVTWIYFGFVAVALWLGPIIQLKPWMMDLSVMNHVATPPVEDIAWRPLAIIAAIAVGLIIVGMIAFRQRNIG